MNKRSILVKILTFSLLVVMGFSLVPAAAPVQAATAKKAIYILPGYLESQIYSKKYPGVTIWPGMGLATEIASDAMGQQAEMTNNANGTGMLAYADRTRDTSGVIGLFLPMITSIKANLVANGLQNTYNVEFFSYNCLADLNDTAKELAADIKAKGYESVILISHSNGGLLASTYISQSATNKNKVEKAICVATPLLGTYLALEPVETGAVSLMSESFATGLLKLGYDTFLRPISKQWVQNWAKNSPNTYQLQAGNEYVSRIPLLNRTANGTQAVSNPADYYALLNKSPNTNNALVNGGNRSLKYLRETVYGKDVLQKWQGIDMTMIACEYGFITPISAVYHMSGTKAIYDGQIFGKSGDGFVNAMSMNGDGRYKYVNVPGVSHLEIVADLRTLSAINDIILGKPVSSFPETSTIFSTSSTSPAIGMSDMIRVEIKSSDPLSFPTLTNAGISVKIFDKKGLLVAQSRGEAQMGFSLNNFIYTSWSTSEHETNIICYIPKSGYTMEVFSGNANRSASDLRITTMTLDRSGAFLSQNEYKVTGANLLTGLAFSLDSSKSMAPVPSLGAKSTTISTANYNQNWQFTTDTLDMVQGTTVTPGVTGIHAASMQNANYTWTSSNTAVATVSSAGAIKAVAPGTAYITATGKDGSCKIETIKVVVTKQVSVTFDAQGGSPAPAPVAINSGMQVTQPENPVKEGFVFAGWYNGTKAYDFGAPVTANLTLTAKWTQITSVVTFDSQGGTAKTAAKVNYGAKVAKPTNPTKTGYAFDGWYLDGALYDFNAPVTSDMTLTAGWTANTLTVKFDAQGGSPAPAAGTTGYGTLVSQPDDPVKEGFIFLGWYNGTKINDFSKPVTANLNLTAKWEQITCVVTFDSQGGTAKTAAKVKYGAKASKPTNPTKSGSVFDGWYLDGELYDFNAPVTSDITLTAKWR
ncbi:MAG: InlB B-repeat-containing protein [Peptococcaceae bacterium]|nr:InlB B-repeat-containing protein [Peptococcaceae bacterium]